MKLLVKERNRLTLPKEVLPDGVEILDLEVDERGRIILTPLSPTPTSQLYYWSPTWQKAEQQANIDAKSGRLKQYADVDDLFARSNHRSAPSARSTRSLAEPSASGGSGSLTRSKKK